MPNITGVDAPVVGDDRSTYPDKITDSLNAIDAHDHSTTKGVQIPTGGIVDGAVTADKLSTDSVTTGKILALNVTEAKLAALSVTAAKLAADSVETAKILNSNVTTAKIANGAVTLEKLAALNRVVSLSTDDWDTSSIARTAVPDLTVTITTTGRPVLLMIQPAEVETDLLGPDALFNEAIMGGFSSSGVFNMSVEIDRGSTTVAEAKLAVEGLGSGLGAMISFTPNLMKIDLPAAGTYTYQVYVDFSAGLTALMNGLSLVAIEL